MWEARGRPKKTKFPGSSRRQGSWRPWPYLEDSTTYRALGPTGTLDGRGEVWRCPVSLGGMVRPVTSRSVRKAVLALAVGLAVLSLFSGVDVALSNDAVHPHSHIEAPVTVSSDYHAALSPQRRSRLRLPPRWAGARFRTKVNRTVIREEISTLREQVRDIIPITIFTAASQKQTRKMRSTVTSTGIISTITPKMSSGLLRPVALLFRHSGMSGSRLTNPTGTITATTTLTGGRRMPTTATPACSLRSSRRNLIPSS